MQMRTMGRTGFGIVLICVLAATVGATPGLAALTFQGDPQAVSEVQAAYQKTLAAPSWRSKMTTSGHTSMMEHVAPDRFHMLPPPGVDGAPETYSIGRDFWVITGGKCQKVPMSMPFTNPREAVEKGGDAKITVTRGGPEAVDGTPTMTYNLTVDSKGKQTQEKLYVALDTGFVRRIVIPSPQGQFTVDYVDIGAPIAINPPC